MRMDNSTRPTRFTVRPAQPWDIPALMRLKRLLAQSEDSLHAVCATEADWLRDGFGPNAGFTAFVAERADIATGDSVVGNSIVGMATCSQRVVTGWNGPVIFSARSLRRCRVSGAGHCAGADGAGRSACARARQPDRRTHGARRQSGAAILPEHRLCPLPQCLTFVLSGPALVALAQNGQENLAQTG
jgi:hypothetical protein